MTEKRTDRVAYSSPVYRRGFTLIELLVVIAIIGVLVAPSTWRAIATRASGEVVSADAF